MGSDITKGTLLECRTILLNKKSDILNQLQNVRRELEERRQDTSGDEIDQSLTVLAENQMLSATQRLRGLLVEIEAALHRIETGHFGICEETEEPIEADRLKAIPWTRLSIEGAEIRDAMKSKFA
ncbi:MAG: molecular chaperone DnaK [Bdellovibrionaceae bacterium]|nr:molecular chaperone DnaK [Pseudobdellovibrionaceae bacterium]